MTSPLAEYFEKYKDGCLDMVVLDFSHFSHLILFIWRLKIRQKSDIFGDNILSEYLNLEWNFPR